MRADGKKHEYLEEIFGLQDADLRMARDLMREHGCEGISLASHEARILQFFIRTLGFKKVVEVGTLFGSTALAMAKALPADGRVWTLEKNPDNRQQALKVFAAAADAGKKITSLEGNAVSLLAGLTSEGPFDLIFIDANKDGYGDYLAWAEKNIRPGGLIIGDNTYLFGHLWGEGQGNMKPSTIETMRHFNSHLASSPNFETVMIPTAEGMTVARRI